MNSLIHPRLSEHMTVNAALEVFDSLPPVAVEDIHGEWEGYEIKTGHPMEGLLEASAWYGKEFRTSESVFPLVHRGFSGKQWAINPALMPLGLIMLLPFLKNPVTTFLFKLFMPLFSTRKGKARLRMMQFRGQVSAAMIYDAKPINDHFRLLEDGHLMGIMDLKGVAGPYFFGLKKK